ncbi:Uncharacterised protein [Escherichia coli]|nr:Uncharacterised protein [Escherichia coli]CTV21845.1 Uncharacterised protein [Escherichia coli]CTY16132.1 Uncharacterised protein [Escherichia coli]CTY17554.1 Uncharacterised protein [Escherichia coli]
MGGYHPAKKTIATDTAPRLIRRKFCFSKKLHEKLHPLKTRFLHGINDQKKAVC